MASAALEGWGAAYGALVLRWRWAIICLTLVVVVAAGLGLRGLTFNPDSRVFFGPEDPGRQALDQLENTFTRAKSLIFVLAPADGEVFTVETLDAVRELTERAWRTPYSSRVNSLTNFQHSYAVGDELIVEDLVPDVATLDAAGLRAVRATALGETELVDRIVSAQAHVTALTVDVLLPQKDRHEVEEVVTFGRALADEMRRDYPSLDVYLTGGVMADITFSEAAQRDMTRLIPGVVVLVAIMLAIGLRSASASLATLVVVVLSVVMALGLAGWSGLVLNSATAGTPIVILTLSVADCVHIVSTMRQREAEGQARAAAIIESLRINTMPVAITSLTTAIGFLTLNFSESPPLREFGNIVALGVVVAYLLSLTFLPAVLTFLPVGRQRGIDLRAMMGRFADAVIAWRRPILIGGPVVLIIVGTGFTKLVIDDDIVRYFDESFAFRTDTDFMAANLTGINTLQFALPAGEQHAIAEPAYLRNLAAFADWYRQQPEVRHVSVLSDTIARLNMNMHGDDPAERRLPESRELAAQYLLLYEMSLPFGQDLNNRIDIGRSTTRLTVHLDDVTSAQVRELAARGEQWLKDHAPEMASVATGLSVIYAHMSERNIKSMLLGTTVALVLISAVLLVVLRSVPLGLLSLVPNLVPAFLAFGLWGHLNGEVNLAVSVIGAMTLGIVVDDTVHLLARYLRGRRELGLEPVDAVRYSVASVGTPILVTSLALIIGFGAMVLSGFAVTALMGSLSALAILLALIADLTFLPALLISLGKRAA